MERIIQSARGAAALAAGGILALMAGCGGHGKDATSLSGRAQGSVLTQHNDNGRTGAFLQEVVLNTSNVNVGQFGKLFTRAVDGQIYAQPLYVPNLNIAGSARNVVFAATEHNSVYAFDADDPSAAQPLWKVNLGPAVPSAEYVPAISPEIGITSTPVIDLSTNTLYVVAKTKEGDAYVHRLHALDIITGAQINSVVIEASVPGTGSDSENGTVPFNPRRALQRPGLLLYGGVVYVAFGSHGDEDPYHGWILGYDAASLQRVATYCTTPDGGKGGIWQGGKGLSADANGNIYVITGNGDADKHLGGSDLGNSFIKLHVSGGNLAVADWFTPEDYEHLNEVDDDLGGSGAMLLPDTDLLVGGGKGGTLYVLNRNNLGHFSGGDSRIVQEFASGIGHIHISPVYWKSPDRGPLIYVWQEEDVLKAFRFDGAGRRFETAPIARGTAFTGGHPGGMLSVSANESTPGTGIVWATHPTSGGTEGGEISPGVLRAFDASDVSKELWNSRQNADRDDVGGFAKFCAPTIANGKVYIATFSGQLAVYGLLDGSRSAQPGHVPHG